MKWKQATVWAIGAVGADGQILKHSKCACTNTHLISIGGVVVSSVFCMGDLKHC